MVLIGIHLHQFHKPCPGNHFCKCIENHSVAGHKNHYLNMVPQHIHQYLCCNEHLYSPKHTCKYNHQFHQYIDHCASMAVKDIHQSQLHNTFHCIQLHMYRGIHQSNQHMLHHSCICYLDNH